MADPRHDEDDLETLRAIAEGQGIDPAGMSAQELAATLREAGVAEGPPAGAGTGAHVIDPDDEGRPGGEYGGEGVGRRETAGGPTPGAGPDAGPDEQPH